MSSPSKLANSQTQERGGLAFGKTAIVWCFLIFTSIPILNIVFGMLIFARTGQLARIERLRQQQHSWNERFAITTALVNVAKSKEKTPSFRTTRASAQSSIGARRCRLRTCNG